LEIELGTNQDSVRKEEKITARSLGINEHEGKVSLFAWKKGGAQSGFELISGENPARGGILKRQQLERKSGESLR